MPSTCLQLLTELKTKEENAVSKFNPRFLLSNDPNASLRQAARNLLMLDTDWRVDCLNEGEWGTWVPGVPVLWQLITQPRLIVDIEDISNQAFENYYKLPIRWMEKLIARGFVIPNYYSFGLEKPIAQPKHPETVEPLL